MRRRFEPYRGYKAAQSVSHAAKQEHNYGYYHLKEPRTLPKEYVPTKKQCEQASGSCPESSAVSRSSMAPMPSVRARPGCSLYRRSSTRKSSSLQNCGVAGSIPAACAQDHARVPQPARGPAFQAGCCEFESRLSFQVAVAQWTRASPRHGGDEGSNSLLPLQLSQCRSGAIGRHTALRPRGRPVPGSSNLPSGTGMQGRPCRGLGCPQINSLSLVEVAQQVDAPGREPAIPQRPCEFESRLRHQ